MTRSLVAILLAASAVAHAGTKEEAQVHIDLATTAHEAGDYEKALSELQIAYTFDPKPALLYAIGQVYAKLGKCTEAGVFYAKFRKADPSVRAVVDQAIAACKPHDAPVAATTPPSPPPEAPRREVSPPVEPAPSPSPWYADKLGDALVLGGAAATVAGIVFYASARSDLTQAEAATTLAGYDQLVDDAHRARTTSVILLASGGVLVTAGVVRYLLRGGRETESHSVAVAPLTGGGLVTWGGRF